MLQENNDNSPPMIIKKVKMRGDDKLEQWANDDTLIEASKFMLLIDISPQQLEDLVNNGEIFCFSCKNRQWYPKEFLNFTWFDLKNILQELKEVDDCGKFLFLLRRHPKLAMYTPAQAVKQGMLNQVIKVARIWVKQ